MSNKIFEAPTPKNHAQFLAHDSVFRKQLRMKIDKTTAVKGRFEPRDHMMDSVFMCVGKSDANR